MLNQNRFNIVFIVQNPSKVKRKQNPYQIKNANSLDGPPLCHPLDMPIIKEDAKARTATILYSNKLMSF